MNKKWILLVEIVTAAILLLGVLFWLLYRFSPKKKNEDLVAGNRQQPLTMESNPFYKTLGTRLGVFPAQ
jgi:hypothetical protein